MPTDISKETVDWERYIAGTNNQPFDAKKFFWWRNYRNFGTGVAGDLFVHRAVIGLLNGNRVPELSKLGAELRILGNELATNGGICNTTNTAAPKSPGNLETTSGN